jgi:hypothetical protein
MNKLFIVIACLFSFAFLSFPPDADASDKCDSRQRKVFRQGHGLYLGVTPFYERSPRRHLFSPHLIPHAHIGCHNPRYHHRGNIILPPNSRGYGVGVGLRFGIFRSRNIGLGIHFR